MLTKEEQYKRIREKIKKNGLTGKETGGDPLTPVEREFYKNYTRNLLKQK